MGTVADGKSRTLTESPQPLLLRPLKQAPAEALTLVARGRAGHADTLAAIRREVHALARVMRRLLVGVAPTDPLVLFGAPAVIAAVAVLALYLPARQAGRVDPLVAIREE